MMNIHFILLLRGLSLWLSGKVSACKAGDVKKNNNNRRRGFDPWVRKIPWRRKWQLTPVFLPGESHGQRSMVGYSPWGCKRVRHDLVTAYNIITKNIPPLMPEHVNNMTWFSFRSLVPEIMVKFVYDFCLECVLFASKM